MEALEKCRSWKANARTKPIQLGDRKRMNRRNAWLLVLSNRGQAEAKLASMVHEAERQADLVRIWRLQPGVSGLDLTRSSSFAAVRLMASRERANRMVRKKAKFLRASCEMGVL